MNDMRDKTIAVSNQITQWERLLNHFGIKVGRGISSRKLKLNCPACGQKATFAKRKPYPVWSCENDCHLAYFDSYVGLIRCALEENEPLTAGQTLGRIEAYLLSHKANGTLPDDKITFGKYRGWRWNQVPLNYLKWVCDNNVVRDELCYSIASYLNIHFTPSKPQLPFN